MYATVRRDDRAVPAACEPAQAGRALTAALGHVPGFISCVLLDVGDGTLVSIVICEDPAGLEEAGRLLNDWLAAHFVVASDRPAQIIAGEVIVQKGL
jgi:hypothetical protein